MEAKWESVVHHITNLHGGFENPLFPQCQHGDLDDRMWLQHGKWHTLQGHVDGLGVIYIYIYILGDREWRLCEGGWKENI